MMKASVRLLGPAEVRDLAELLQLQPTKRLGQNFVVDANTVRRIVRTAGVGPGSSVLEVGPGLGSLTLGLLAAGASVFAVEIDDRLAAQLPATVRLMTDAADAADAADPAPDTRSDSRHGTGAPATDNQDLTQLTVITADALTIDELPGEPHTIVANLPYNVSVPVLLHLLERFPFLRSGLVMVQAEVGQRIASPPGSKVYGSPSVKAAWYGDWQVAGQVSRQVFWPVPNVDSILVSFERRPDALGSDAERVATFRLVDAAFQQRRKMLRQALAGELGGSAAAAETLQRAGLEPTLRGEQLSVADFLAVVRARD